MNKYFDTRIDRLIFIPAIISIVFCCAFGAIRIFEFYESTTNSNKLINNELIKLAEEYIILGDEQSAIEFQDNIQEVASLYNIKWVDVLDFQRVPVISKKLDRNDYYVETLEIEDTSQLGYIDEYTNFDKASNKSAIGYIVIYRERDTLFVEIIKLSAQLILTITLILFSTLFCVKKVKRIIKDDLNKVTQDIGSVLSGKSELNTNRRPSFDIESLIGELNNTIKRLKDSEEKTAYLESELYEITSLSNKQIYLNYRYIESSLNTIKKNILEIDETYLDPESKDYTKSCLILINEIMDRLSNESENTDSNMSLEMVNGFDKKIKQTLETIKGKDGYDLPIRVTSNIESGYVYIDISKVRRFVQLLVEAFQNTIGLNPMLMVVINKPISDFSQMSIILTPQTSNLSTFIIEQLKEQLSFLEAIADTFDANLSIKEGSDHRIMVTGNILLQHCETNESKPHKEHKTNRINVRFLEGTTIYNQEKRILNHLGHNAKSISKDKVQEENIDILVIDSSIPPTDIDQIPKTLQQTRIIIPYLVLVNSNDSLIKNETINHYDKVIRSTESITHEVNSIASALRG